MSLTDMKGKIWKFTLTFCEPKSIILNVEGLTYPLFQRKVKKDMPKTGRPKSENPKDRRVNIRLEDDLFDKFDEECKKINVEKSTLIRKWIVMFLESRKKEVDS